MKSPPIYVELHIHSEMDDLWELTQKPQLHEQWDLRFTNIQYLPRPDPAMPQRFQYVTRIGFGFRIEGEGESVGENDGPSGRVSSLKFWSADPKSLILEGSGYWKYVQKSDGVCFLTRYDYRTRFGWIGRVVDRFVFRPLLGWATAWSFDRLRLWLERDIPPRSSMQKSVVHAIARIGLAIIWVYQGLIPKLLFTMQSGEQQTVRAIRILEGHEETVLWIAGALEIAFGIAMLVFWHWRWLLLLNVIAMIILLLSVALTSPLLLVGQFNPVTLNLAIVALALCAWVASHNIPTSRNCNRRERSGA